MEHYTSKIALSFFFVLFASFANINLVSSDCSSLDKYFGIKVFYSTNVLQASGDVITIAESDGSDEQLWQLVPSARLGTFHILSKSSGKALDVNGYNATLNDLNDSVYQQWFLNWDFTIINGGLTNYALDIPGSDYSVGNYVQLGDRIDDDHIDNQKFIFQYR